MAYRWNPLQKRLCKRRTKTPDVCNGEEKKVPEAVDADSLERIAAHFRMRRTIVKLVLRGIDHRGHGEHGGGEKSMAGGKVRVKGGKEKRPIDAEGASGAAAPFEINW